AMERLGRWGKVALAAAVFEGAVSVALMMPVPLSYFSPLVGGLPGAARLGMEPTYFWDGLTDEPLGWLNRETKPGEKILFATNPTNWQYLRDHGRLKHEFRPDRIGFPAWYVIQNRPGAFHAVDQALLTRATPAYVYKKLGIPLIWVFHFRDFETLRGAGGIAQ
ncbi:glycosyltransferase family 39 protein, partial [Singulisphaera rosea]